MIEKLKLKNKGLEEQLRETDARLAGVIRRRDNKKVQSA
jgi:hypothetical protein